MRKDGLLVFLQATRSVSDGWGFDSLCVDGGELGRVGRKERRRLTWRSLFIFATAAYSRLGRGGIFRLFGTIQSWTAAKEKERDKRKKRKKVRVKYN